MAYQKQQEIDTFICRAQNWIAEYGHIMLRDSNYDQIDLANALSRAVETFLDPTLRLPEEHVIQIVHYLTERANLFELPIVCIPSLVYTIVSDEDCGCGHKGDDEGRIKDIIHNLLKGLQGGNGLDEYYHLNKHDYDWVRSNANPKIPPTVGLGLVTPRPSTQGFFEKGLALVGNKLIPSVQVNDGGVITQLRLYANGVLLTTRSQNFLDDYIDEISRYNTVLYRMEVDFSAYSTLSAQVGVNFIAPCYDAVLALPTTLPILIRDGHKELRFRPSELEILFPFPGVGPKPAFAFPAEWGLPSDIKVGGFSNRPSWNMWADEAILHAGSDTRQNYHVLQCRADHYQPFVYTFYWK